MLSQAPRILTTPDSEDLGIYKLCRNHAQVRLSHAKVFPAPGSS